MLDGIERSPACAGRMRGRLLVLDGIERSPACAGRHREVACLCWTA